MNKLRVTSSERSSRSITQDESMFKIEQRVRFFQYINPTNIDARLSPRTNFLSLPTLNPFRRLWLAAKVTWSFDKKKVIIRIPFHDSVSMEHHRWRAEWEILDGSSGQPIERKKRKPANHLHRFLVVAVDEDGHHLGHGSVGREQRTQHPADVKMRRFLKKKNFSICCLKKMLQQCHKKTHTATANPLPAGRPYWFWNGGPVRIEERKTR